MRCEWGMGRGLGDRRDWRRLRWCWETGSAKSLSSPVLPVSDGLRRRLWGPRLAGGVRAVGVGGVVFATAGRTGVRRGRPRRRPEVRRLERVMGEDCCVELPWAAWVRRFLSLDDRVGAERWW